MTDPTIPAEPEPCEYCGAKDTGTSPQRSSVATAAASSTAASTARGCSTWTPCPAPGATTTCKDSTPMPADPTIPELVARLRELHAKLQALQVGTPEFTEARQLFRDVLQLSAPGILDALDHLESLTTWRPISEPPSAEVHAWCGGRYLMRHDDGELLSEHWDREFHWDAWASGYREYLPIPPSDERRG